MILTNKQEAGLRTVISRFKAGEKFAVIAGFAGSGKSTLVKFIVQSLGVSEDDIAYACYTGKAAAVLLRKGNKNVTTLHKLLYTHYPLPNGGFARRKTWPLLYRVVIVDECSMVPTELVKLLLSHKVFVIFLGDPGQLPPVSKDDNNLLLEKPHVFLDEIHRQALDSEIIRLSMDIREGKNLKQFNGKDVKVLPKEELTTGMMEWADQILCATNATRVAINNEMRALRGLGGDPQDGDKVICWRNYWDCLADTKDPLINGTIGHIHNPFTTFATYPRYMGGTGTIDMVSAHFISETGADYGTLDMDKGVFDTGEFSLSPKLQYALGKKRPDLIPYEFAYGYAITTHKAQGSEWEKVLVLEERFPFSREDHKRWLYTAATRASDKLVLLTKE